MLRIEFLEQFLVIAMLLLMLLLLKCLFGGVKCSPLECGGGVGGGGGVM